VQLHYAQRKRRPGDQIALSFDAGYSADAAGRARLAEPDPGPARRGHGTSRSSQEIAEEQERLGAQISASGNADRSTVAMSALSANLGPSLDLLADIVRNPAFAPAEVERVRAQILTAISQQLKDPNAMAARVLPALLYGEAHPYATTAIGDPKAVEAFTATT
jgi:zinc protease